MKKKDQDPQELLKQLFAGIETYLTQTSGDAANINSDDDEDEDDDQDDEDEDSIEASILEDLAKDYQDFMIWSFGKMKDLNFTESVNRWKKRHADLPFPRVLRTPNLPGVVVIQFFIMDAYHLYLKEKEEG